MLGSLTSNKKETNVPDVRPCETAIAGECSQREVPEGDVVAGCDRWPAVGINSSPDLAPEVKCRN